MIPGIVVVMLAGHMRSTSLRDSLEIPTVLLPLRRSATVLEAWLEVLDEAFIDEVRIAINLAADTATISAAIASIANKRSFRADVKPALEPAAWRGPGGVVRDLTMDLEPETIVVVVEGNSAPVSSVRDVISAVQGGADGAVGVFGANSPAGVSAFRRVTLERIPTVGYFDLKEQFLPNLYEAKYRIRPVSILRGSQRIHDLDSYLIAVGNEIEVENQVVTYSKDEVHTVIDRTAVVHGKCLIESGVSIKENVVVHQSVILNGASIGKGAVVARSVIGPGTQVRAGAHIVDTIFGDGDLLPKSVKADSRGIRAGLRSLTNPHSGASRS